MLYLEDIIGPSICSRITSIVVGMDVAQELFRMEMLEKLPSLRQVWVQVKRRLYFANVGRGTTCHSIKRGGDGSREVEFTLTLRYPQG
jgi:hypothetical protein